MKNKMIVFDVDKSLSTIGSVEEQTEVFGIQPIPLMGGIDQINEYLDRFLEINAVPIEHDLLGTIGEKYVVSFNEKAKEMGINILGIDSLSVLGMQERAMIMKKDQLELMELQSWGKYGDRMTKFINKLSKTDFKVICTCHSKRDKDENGLPIEVPALKGASADEAPRFFDVIVYTQVSASNEATTYSWVINPTRRYTFAKNRKGVFKEQSIPQDFGLIYEKYAEIGIDNPRILVIGDSGQGKSWSLQTINSKSE